MRIKIFTMSTKEIKSKERLVLLIRYYELYHILGVPYIFIFYTVHVLYMSYMFVILNIWKFIVYSSLFFEHQAHNYS